MAVAAAPPLPISKQTDTNQAIRASEPTAVSFQQPAATYQTARRSSYDGNVFDGASAPQEPAVTGRQRPAVASEAEVIKPGTMQFEPMAANGVFAGGRVAPTAETPMARAAAIRAKGRPAASAAILVGRCSTAVAARCCAASRSLRERTASRGRRSRHERELRPERGHEHGPAARRSLGLRLPAWREFRANRLFRSAGDPPTPTSGPRFGSNTLPPRASSGAPMCRGFQWGVAYDYLYDMYYSNASLQQLRSETGYVIDDTYEIGYYGDYGVGNASGDGRPASIQIPAHRHVRSLCAAQFRERRRRAAMGRGHRQRRRTAGRQPVGPAGKKFRPGEPHQLHDSQAGHRRYGPAARIVGAGGSVGVVSRPQCAVPKAEPVPPDSSTWPTTRSSWSTG